MRAEIAVRVATRAPIKRKTSFLAIAASSAVSPVASSCRRVAISSEVLGVGKMDSINCSTCGYLANVFFKRSQRETNLSASSTDLEEVGIFWSVLLVDDL